MRKDSVCSSLSTSRAPSATSYVSSTALSHTLENGDTSVSQEVGKVTYLGFKHLYNKIHYNVKNLTSIMS